MCFFLSFFACFYPLHSFRGLDFFRFFSGNLLWLIFRLLFNFCAKRRVDSESESGEDGEEAAQEIAEPEEPSDK